MLYVSADFRAYGSTRLSIASADEGLSWRKEPAVAAARAAYNSSGLRVFWYWAATSDSFTLLNYKAFESGLAAFPDAMHKQVLLANAQAHYYRCARARAAVVQEKPTTL
jgi:hypothetical protein